MECVHLVSEQTFLEGNLNNNAQGLECVVHSGILKHFFCVCPMHAGLMLAARPAMVFVRASPVGATTPPATMPVRIDATDMHNRRTIVVVPLGANT